MLVAERRRAVHAEGEGPAIEAVEVGADAEERRIERAGVILVLLERLSAVREHAARAALDGIVAGARELERLEHEVRVEQEARAALLGQAADVVVERERAVGLGGERGAAAERLGAVAGELEAAGERHRRQTKQCHHNRDAIHRRCSPCALRAFRKWTIRIETAAGVTPAMRLAWPIERGRTRPSFSLTSRDRPASRS